jgi:DNA-directed RNA polymerase
MGAFQVNLLPSEKPQDVYTGVANLVAKRVSQDAANGKNKKHNQIKMQRKMT